MIIYDLVCGASHRFEGWFKNVDEFNEQKASGMLSCPVCGSENVRKIPSASHIGKAVNDTGNISDKIENDGRRQVVKMFNDYINNNFDNVGSKFAEEAKKMHSGEIEERNIRGTATSDEIRELKEEGVSAVQLPPIPYDKDKLN